MLTKLAGRLEIKNADERRKVRTRQAVLHSPEFKALWDRIKHKTTYRVEFDTDLLFDCLLRALPYFDGHAALLFLGKEAVLVVLLYSGDFRSSFFDDA